MFKTRLWLLPLAVAVLAAAPAFAGPQEEKLSAQNKLLAMRAARVDAMRKLAERINGLAITSTTTVKDFVATDDRIQTAMTSWLSGMKEVGEPKYTPDGICQVTLEVTVQEVIVELKRLHKEYYKGDKVRYEDIDQITANTKETTLTETGSGAPRPEFEARGTDAKPGATGEDIMSKNAWAYWMAHCTGRGRLMAERAAEVDALRKLGERINGLLITSETTVKDFVATDDRIRTQMATFMRGAHKVATRYHDSELIVDVEMEVTVAELVATLEKWHKEYYKGNKIAVADIERISARTETKDIRETGSGVPPDEYLKDLPPAGVQAVALGKQAANWPPTMRVVGQAAIDNANTNAAQAKLMAVRAAELDGRRKIAEQLDGLRISSKTTVKDFVTMDDQIRTSMLTFQQGCRPIKDSEKFLPDGTVQVTVEIELDGLWNMVLYFENKLSLKIMD